MIQSLYGEIVVRGAEFVSVRLSPEAYAYGLALAPPQEVVVAPLPSRGRPRKTLGIGARDRIQPRRCQKYPYTGRRSRASAALAIECVSPARLSLRARY